MRYFMFSYYYKSGFGTYYTGSENFPSKSELESKIGSEIIIISFSEFKSKEDYLNAQK